MYCPLSHTQGADLYAKEGACLCYLTLAATVDSYMKKFMEEVAA